MSTSYDNRPDRILRQMRLAISARYTAVRTAINASVQAEDPSADPAFVLPALSALQVLVRVQPQAHPELQSYPAIRISPQAQTQQILYSDRVGKGSLAVDVAHLLRASDLSIPDGADAEEALTRGGWALAEAVQRCVGHLPNGDGLATVIGVAGVHDVDAVTGLSQVHRFDDDGAITAISVMTTYVWSQKKTF